MQSERQSGEDWRPGFAKRAENFDEVCRLARAWRWRPGETVGRVCAAILKGTPLLTQGQRHTLMLYAEHLNQDRLEQNSACVWPSASLIGAYLGCSERVARGYRKALEAAGYMVRDFNQANRPAGVEAYDLAPLMARLGEMEAAAEGIRQAIADRRAAYLTPVVRLHHSTGRPDSSSRLEQSQENYSPSVTGADAPSARSISFAQPATRPANVQGRDSAGQRQRTGTVPRGSPRGARFGSGAKSADSPAAETVLQELVAALEACPRIAQLLPPTLLSNPLSAGPLYEAAIAEAAQALLPNPERNNDRTALWGWRRHGVRVVAMLAIALEDPEVKNPCAYFGKLALSTPGGALDLRANLTRILRSRATPPRPPAPPPQASPVWFDNIPGADDPTWRRISAELKKLIRTGAYGSWFSRLGFTGLAGGALGLTTPNRICADKLRADFLPEIRRAAALAGLEVERVIISVRQGPPPPPEEPQ